VNRQVEEILERPLYQRWKRRHERREADPSAPQRGWFDEWLERVSNWTESVRRKLREWWDWLFPPRDQPLRESLAVPGQGIGELLKLAGWAVVAVIVAFLALVVYRLVRESKTGYHSGRVLSREQVRTALEEGEALTLGGEEWLREADRLAALQQFRAVYRSLYLALLSGLHSAGKIDYRKNRTNWTYVNRFRGEEAERTSFASLTSLFDDVWYGLKPADDYSIDELRRQVASLIGENRP
jgi:hypothetical protein